MANVLTVKDLRVHFHDAAPDRFAVDGLNLTVAQGEIIGRLDGKVQPGPSSVQSFCTLTSHTSQVS